MKEFLKKVSKGKVLLTLQAVEKKQLHRESFKVGYFKKNFKFLSFFNFQDLIESLQLYGWQKIVIHIYKDSSKNYSAT
jgi:hypothetical protein